MKNQLKICSEPLYSKKKSQGICVVSKCVKASGKQRVLCFTHKREKQKFDNPLTYWYSVFKQNARKRKIFCDVTLEQFKEFCERTKYLEKKGKDSGSYTIDKIRNDLGYTAGNLQILTLSSNSRKRWIDQKILFGRYPTEEELNAFIEASRLPENPEPQIHIELEDNDEVPF